MRDCEFAHMLGDVTSKKGPSNTRYVNTSSIDAELDEELERKTKLSNSLPKTP